MKICIVNFEPLETAGGAGTSSFSISKELVKKGDEVHYIVMSTDKYWESEVRGVKLYHVQTYSGKSVSFINTINKYLIYSLDYFLEIQKLLVKIQPDVLISFGTIPAFHTYVYNLRKRRKIPYIISFRHNPLLRSTSFMPLRLKHLWAKIPIIKSSVAFTSPSRALSDSVEPYIKHKILTIPNGIDATQYFPLAYEVETKIEHPVLLCLSRLSPEKRVKDVILAMPKILNQYPNAILRIVGDGIEREMLYKLAKEEGVSNSVEFIGHISHEKVIIQYHSASIFILPSDDEGFPNTFLEAISCGLPVITTPVGDLEEIVPNVSNGILVNFRSPNEIADAVCEILSDSDRYKEFSDRSLQLSTEYSWENVALMYQKILREILDSI